MASSSSSYSQQQSRPVDIREFLMNTVGFIPKDAFGWLYACRGLYQLREYSLVVDGLAHCLRHEKTAKESQHLLAFALLHTKQNKLAAAAFFKSIKLGNETDWQPMVELCIEQPKLKLSGVVAGGAAMSASASSSDAASTAAGM